MLPDSLAFACRCSLMCSVACAYSSICCSVQALVCASAPVSFIFLPMRETLCLYISLRPPADSSAGPLSVLRACRHGPYGAGPAHTQGPAGRAHRQPLQSLAHVGRGARHGGPRHSHVPAAGHHGRCERLLAALLPVRCCLLGCALCALPCSICLRVRGAASVPACLPVCKLACLRSCVYPLTLSARSARGACAAGGCPAQGRQRQENVANGRALPLGSLAVSVKGACSSTGMPACLPLLASVCPRSCSSVWVLRTDTMSVCALCTVLVST